MQRYVTSFVTFTKISDELKVFVSTCTIDRIEELPGGGARIVQDQTYVDVREDASEVEQTVGAKHVELAEYENTLRNIEDGDDWKFED